MCMLPPVFGDYRPFSDLDLLLNALVQNIKSLKGNARPKGTCSLSDDTANGCIIPALCETPEQGAQR